jgi:hypothetical protein
MNLLFYLGLYLGLNILGFILNLVRLLRTKRYQKQYITWLLTGDSKIDLMEHQQSVKNLVSKAGKGGMRIPVTQALGYGQIANFSADPFLAFPNRLENVAHMTNQILKSCVGIYRSRMWNSFNPFYWLGILVLLPKHLFEYLGISGDKVVVKIFNILWWAFSSLVTVVLLRENAKPINDFITELFK